jgi:hypothetical protein
MKTERYRILVIIFMVVLSPAACYNNNKQNLPLTEVFEISFAGVDTCISLKKWDSIINATRRLDIVSNSLTDTVVFGTSILPPRYVGEFWYLQIDNRRDISEYPGNDINVMSRTKMLCIHPTPYTRARGRLKVRVYY